MNPLKMSVLALAFMVSAPVTAGAQVDVTGDWTVTVDSPQGASSIDATMKQSGEDLAGTITSPMGAVEFKGKVLKDALNVSYTLNLQGNSIEITMSGTVAGDSMTGNLNFGGLGDVPWSAKRKAGGSNGSAAAPAATPAPAANGTPAAGLGDVSGKWDITFNMAGNPMPATATFTQAGGQVTGTISSMTGETAVNGVMTGSALKLDFNVDTPQGQISITMTGELSATGLAGKATIVGLGDAEWTATRAK